MFNFLSILLVINLCTFSVYADNESEAPRPWFPRFSESLGATPFFGKHLQKGYESSVVQDGAIPAAAIGIGMNILCCCTPLITVAPIIGLGTGIAGGCVNYNIASIFSVVKTMQRAVTGIKTKLDQLTKAQGDTLAKVENVQIIVNEISERQQQQGIQITRIEDKANRVDASTGRIEANQKDLIEQQEKMRKEFETRFKKMQKSLRLANNRLKKMEIDLNNARTNMSKAVSEQGRQIQEISNNVRHITNSLVIESSSNKPLALPYHVPVSQISAPSYVVSGLAAASLQKKVSSI